MNGKRASAAFLLVAVVAASLIAADTDPPISEILDKCVRTTVRNTHARDSYTYRFHDEVTELNRSGHTTATHSRLVEVIYFAGKPYEHLLEKDGKKLTEAEQKHEEQKMDQAAAEASKLSKEQKTARIQKLDREREKRSELFRYIPLAYNFTLQSPTVLNSRENYVMDAAPKQNYNGKYSKIFRKTKGKLFIDKNDYTLTRLELEVLDEISAGLFLARISPGTRITFEQVRINDEVWLPKSLTLHADARALIKTFRFDEQFLFSDYRKFQSESRVLGSGGTAPPQ